jgi:hypothetical protein
MDSERTRETQKIIVESIDNPYHSSYIPLIHQECNVEYDEFETRTTSDLALHRSHQSCAYIIDQVCRLLPVSCTPSQCWGLHYPPGSTVYRHHHVNTDYTFVYYISVPHHTPLLFDDFFYMPRERDLVVFSSSLYHEVAPVSHDRYVIAGDLNITKDLTKDKDSGNVRLRGSAQATGSDIKLLRTLIED